MQKIIKGKGQGKTEALIKISNQSKEYIVCSNTDQATQISLRAQELKLPIPFPITYDEFIKKDYHAYNIKGFLIDDIDILIQYISTTKISAVTMNVPDSNISKINWRDRTLTYIKNFFKK